MIGATLLLAAALAQAPAEPVASVHAAGQGQEAAKPQEAPEAHGSSEAHEAAPRHEAAGEGAGAEHESTAGHLMHHVVDERYRHLFVFGVDVGPTKHLVFFLVAAGVVLFWIRLAIRDYREKRVPGTIASAVEALVIFIRDEIAERNIGHDGHKFVPLLLSFFFFILTAALLGLLPFSATSTGNIAVTMGLALVSFAAQQYAGMAKYGVLKHFVQLVPPGLPLFLLPIMIPVEILSMFTKPFALMVRLFANMLAGHMVITTLLLLIPLMAGISTFFGVFMIPVSLSLALFIMILEILVAFIQAYIFTLLTAIFIGMYAHPAH